MLIMGYDWADSWANILNWVNIFLVFGGPILWYFGMYSWYWFNPYYSMFGPDSPLYWFWLFGDPFFFVYYQLFSSSLYPAIAWEGIIYMCIGIVGAVVFAGLVFKSVAEEKITLSTHIGLIVAAILQSIGAGLFVILLWVQLVFLELGSDPITEFL
jgi:hypothetical protein